MTSLISAAACPSDLLATVNAVPLTSLRVMRFGQSADLADVYRHHGIDAETAVGAALDLLA
jgi:pyruvate dehydrogenase E1 component